METKDDEHWSYIETVHPTYIPFEVVTPWICEYLVETYESEGVKRPEWMNAKNDEVCIKRIIEIYTWYRKDVDDVNAALEKLFKNSGADLEKGVDAQVTFIKNKTSKKRIQPE